MAHRILHHGVGPGPVRGAGACGASDVGSGAAESGFHSCHPACAFRLRAEVFQLRHHAAVTARQLEKIPAAEGPDKLVQQQRTGAVKAVPHRLIDGLLLVRRVDGSRTATALPGALQEVAGQLVAVPDEHCFLSRYAKTTVHNVCRPALFQFIPTHSHTRK